MAFEKRTTEDLIKIAASGGGFRLASGLRTTEDLIRIAAAASNNGACLFFTGLQMRTTEDLIRIGAAGRGSVVFED